MNGLPVAVLLPAGLVPVDPGFGARTRRPLLSTSAPLRETTPSPMTAGRIALARIPGQQHRTGSERMLVGAVAVGGHRRVVGDPELAAADGDHRQAAAVRARRNDPGHRVDYAVIWADVVANLWSEVAPVHTPRVAHPFEGCRRG